MTGPRAVLWRLFAVLASLLLPVAMASAWLATVVTDSDAYVDTVGPLASDATVQRAAADRLEGLAVGAVEDRTGATLAPDQRELVGTVVDDVVESPEFEKAWRTANRGAHEQAVRVLEGDNDALVTERGRVSVELGTVYLTVVQLLDERGVLDAAAAPQVQATFPLVGADDLDRVRAIYQALDAAGFWLPALWLVLVALTLLLAPDRRRAVIWLGAGSIVGLLLLVAGLLVGRGVLIGELGTAADDDVIRAIWDVLISRLYWWTGVGFVVATLAIVVAVVLGRRRRPAAAV